MGQLEQPGRGVFLAPARLLTIPTFNPTQSQPMKLKKPSRLNPLLLGACLILAAFLGIGVPQAKAQEQYGANTLSVTNVIPAASTNTAINGVITITKHDLVALQVYLELQGAGTTAITFDIHESIDGTTYDDTPVSTITVTPAGTAGVATVVPINAGAVGFLKLKTGRNANAAAITNMVWKWTPKPKRQG
jgi:hypothetical protein